MKAASPVLGVKFSSSFIKRYKKTPEDFQPLSEQKFCSLYKTFLGTVVVPGPLGSIMSVKVFHWEMCKFKKLGAHDSIFVNNQSFNELITKTLLGFQFP